VGSGVSATAASPLLVLDGVTQRFRDHLALDRMSAVLRPGELVAVIGRSGAGKTTLLRCLAGAVRPSAGVILFGGVEVTRLDGPELQAHRDRVGMIYQQFNLVRRLRVLDNVLIGRLPHLTGWARWASLAGWFSAADREVALRCLDHVGLLSRVWQRADTLSGGEQQRVAIAKVLAQEPALVLADEPVASLDLANGTLVMETLRRVAAEARLPVVATLHHVDYARRYADRVLGLRAGRLVLDVRPDRLTDGVVREVLDDDGAVAPVEVPRAERLAS